MFYHDENWSDEPPVSSREQIDRPSSRPEWFTLNLILGMTAGAWVAALGIRALLT